MPKYNKVGTKKISSVEPAKTAQAAAAAIEEIKQVMSLRQLPCLSAPEIGINQNIFVVSTGHQVLEFVNPSIISFDDEEVRVSFQSVWEYGDKGMAVGEPVKNKVPLRLVGREAIYCLRRSAEEQGNAVYNSFRRYQDIFSGKTPVSVWQKERFDPVKAGVKKVGRNDPCPCGSGRKYKKCCL
jgi:hypothetical protein